MPSIGPLGTPHDMLEILEKNFAKYAVNLRFDKLKPEKRDQKNQ